MVNIEIVDFETVIEVSNFEKSVKYYTEVLDFNLDWTWPDEGKKVHGSLSIGGDSNDHSKKHIHVQISQAEHDFSLSGWIYIRIGPEIDQLYEHYKARNVKFTQDLDNYPWQMREFTIEDIDGNNFRFAYNYLEL